MTRDEVERSFAIVAHGEQAVFRRPDLVRDVIGTLRFDMTEAERSALRRRIVTAIIEDWQTPAGVRRFETIDFWPG